MNCYFVYYVCRMMYEYDSWVLYHELFMYFDMFYIQLHCLAKKDLWNKVYMIMTLQWVLALKRMIA
jgi:hypothetical protein